MSNASCRFSPHEIFVRGIRTIIVDPHNDIIPYWFREYLSHKQRLVVVRIDDHHDMFHCCPALPAREGSNEFHFLDRLMPYIRDYSRNLVNEGNFTCPAFHCGVLGALYHFRPSESLLNAYGRISGSETTDTPGTKVRSLPASSRNGRIRWIFWDRDADCFKGEDESFRATPPPLRINKNDFQRDLQDCLLPVVVGFDLDGLYGNGDRGHLEKVVGKRLAGIRSVLESVPRPAFVCLARSQTPRSYIPAELVDRLQEAALGLVREVYS